MDNLSIYNAVRVVPETAKKKITGGRMNGKTDINPMWRIKVLTEQFGPCGTGWYYKTVNRSLEKYGDEIAAFVDIELYVRTPDGWSMPIPGTGGSMFAEQEKSGIHVSDECFKMATTDAISVSCKQLGIGADVYWNKDETKYSGKKVEESGEENTRDPRYEEIEQELLRTGYTAASICKTYKVDSPYDLSELQIKDFLSKIRNVPDKVA